MGIVGIKLVGCSFTASCAKIIRRYKDISISDIKKIATDNDYLMCCDYVDADGIKKILSLHQDLEMANIPSVIYEHGSVSSVEFLKNLLRSYEETAQQVQLDMNNEALTENVE